MLPTFCPPTIWTISLEFYRKPSILAADDFLGACYRKAMTPKKLWTLLFLHQSSVEPLGFCVMVVQQGFLLCRHFCRTLLQNPEGSAELGGEGEPGSQGARSQTFGPKVPDYSVNLGRLSSTFSVMSRENPQNVPERGGGCIYA